MARVCSNPECPDRDGSGVSEYQETIESCPFCGSRLELAVVAASAGGGSHELDLVEVCVANDPVEAMVVQSILEGAGLDFIASDPVESGWGGWGRVVVGPESAIGPVRFRVRAEDAELARALLTETDPADVDDD